MPGCNKWFWGGAGALYETSNKERLEELEEDRDRGRISQDEYERRKDEIEDRSLIY